MSRKIFLDLVIQLIYNTIKARIIRPIFIGGYMGRITDRLTSMANTFSTYSIGTVPTNTAYAALNPEYTTMQLRRTFGGASRAYSRGIVDARAANTAPTVANAVSTQTAARNTLWTYVIPENTFADLQPVLNATATIEGRRYVIVTVGGTATNYVAIGASAATIGVYFTKNSTTATGTGTVRVADRLTYTATLQDGSALPAWLTFTPSTRTFSGTSPNVGASYTLRVIATDPFGAAVPANFTFTAT
jgi:hypothetical protein